MRLACIHQEVTLFLCVRFRSFLVRSAHLDQDYDADRLFTQCDCHSAMEPSPTPPGSLASDDGLSSVDYGPRSPAILVPGTPDPPVEAEAPEEARDDDDDDDGGDEFAAHREGEKGDAAGKDGPVGNYWCFTLWHEHQPKSNGDPYVRERDLKAAFERMPDIQQLPDVVRACALAHHIAPETGNPHWHGFVDKQTASKRGQLAKLVEAALLEIDPAYYRGFKDLGKHVKRWFQKAYSRRAVSYRGAWTYITAEKAGFVKEEHGYVWHVTGGRPSFKTGKVRYLPPSRIPLLVDSLVDDTGALLGFVRFSMLGNRIYVQPWKRRKQT